MSRIPRGAYYPRGATKLWWADAPASLLNAVMAECRAEVDWFQDGHRDIVIARQNWLRAVSALFHKRLKALGIYVEGA